MSRTDRALRAAMLCGSAGLVVTIAVLLCGSRAEPTYRAVMVIDENRYIVDHGMSYDDCYYIDNVICEEE